MAKFYSVQEKEATGLILLLFPLLTVRKSWVTCHKGFQLHVICSCSITGRLGVKLQAIEGIPAISRKGGSLLIRTLSETVEVKSGTVEGGLKDFKVDERKAKQSKSDNVKDDSDVAVVLSDPEDAQDKRKAVVDVDMDRRWICIYKITLSARDELLLLEIMNLMISM